jgi:type I restriction enzyme S subunit
VKTPLVLVGNCATIVNGFAFKSELFTTERTGLPVVRIRDVVRGHTDTYYTGDYPKTAVIHNGDLLVGMDGEFNIAPWQGGTALLNQRVCKVEARAGVSDIVYLRHALAIALKRVELRTPFATVKHLSSEELKEEMVPLPDMFQQRRIAERLEQAERLVRTRRYTLELTDTFLPAAFLELFGEPLLDKARWPEVELTDLVRRGDKINYGVVQPGFDLRDGVPIIRVADLDDLKSSLPNLKRIAAEIDASHSASKLAGDELLVACVGSIGKVAKAFPGLRGFNIARAVARVPGDWNKIDRNFLAHYLTARRAQHFWLNETRTVSQPTLNILQIEQTPVIMPPLLLQKKFEALVERVECLRAVQHEALRQAEHLFASFLHRTFSA